MHTLGSRNTKGDLAFNKINLNKYTYSRPNFVVLIEHKLPENVADHSLIFNPPYQDWYKFKTHFLKYKRLHSTIRGIFDSKYFELLHSESHGLEISRFPGKKNKKTKKTKKNPKNLKNTQKNAKKRKKHTKKPKAQKEANDQN